MIDMASLTSPPPRIAIDDTDVHQRPTTGVPWSALASAPWPALIVRLPAWDVIASNAAADKMFRPAGESLKDSNLRALVSEDDDAMSTFVETLQLTGVAGSQGVRLRGALGVHFVEMHGVMYAERGQVRVCLTLKDVSERTRRVSRLVNALLEARQALARKTMLAEMGRQVVAAQSEVERLVTGASTLLRFLEADLDQGRPPQGLRADLGLSIQTLDTCMAILHSTDDAASVLGTVEIGEVMRSAAAKLLPQALECGGIDVSCDNAAFVRGARSDLESLALSTIQAFLPHGALTLKVDSSETHVRLEVHRRRGGLNATAQHDALSRAESLARKHRGRLQVVLGANTLVCVVSLPAATQARSRDLTGDSGPRPARSY
jgi:hypothetical protein